MVISLKLKNKILDVLENIINKISVKTGLTKREIGIIIRNVHYMMPIIPLFSVLFINKKFVLMYIIILIIIIILFFFFNGCILSLLEYRLCNEDYTIVDPYLNLMIVDVNNKTRKKYTIFGLMCMLIYFIFVYIIKK